MSQLLRLYPGNLYRVDDALSLRSTIENLLRAPVVPDLEVPTWPSLARRLAGFFTGILRR